MSKQKNLQTMRHSLSHILALAMQQTYPNVKFGIGPAIENGFYYDFDFSKIKNKKFSDTDLPRIQAKMRELIASNLKFEKKVVSVEQAKKIFKDQPYKLELIKELKGKTLSTYQKPDIQRCYSSCC